MVRRLFIPTPGRGLINITAQVARVVHEAAIEEGLCTVFVQHTSASLLIQENADPAVRNDLEAWFARLVRDGDSIFTHDEEGPDDMPSHIRSALTATSLGIPVFGGGLALGTWQGIYLWEHRTNSHTRSIIVHVSP